MNWESGVKVFYDLKLVRCPRFLAPTLVTLPSMSLIPFAPFGKLIQRGLEVFDLSDLSPLISDRCPLPSGYAAPHSMLPCS